MKKFFALFLCFSLFLGISAAYAASPLKLDYQHVSEARLVDGKASYNNAEFGWLNISLVSRDASFDSEAYLKAVGTVSIGAATYNYQEEDNEDNGEKSVEAEPREFMLKAKDGAEVGDSFKYYFRETNGSQIEFLGNADTGLNGVAISWAFSEYPELDGSTTIAELRGTDEQLANAVPYVELVPGSDGNVSSLKWRLVKARDTSTPVSVDFGSRIRLLCRKNGEKAIEITPKGENKFDAGAVVSGETVINPASTDVISVLSDTDTLRYVEVDLYDRSNDIYGYNWRFMPADNDAATSLYATHVSDASFIDGKSSYNDAAFNEIRISIVDKNDKSAVFTENLLEATGEITMPSATYTYDDGNRDNSVKIENEIKRFTLIPEESAEVGNDFEFKPASGDNEVHFTGNADTGLNDKTVTWWIKDGSPSLPSLKGESVMPTFTSTANQLNDVVPYCEAIYDDDGNVSGLTYRLVKTSDTSKAVSVSYTSRITLRCKDTDGALVNFTDGSNKFTSGKISAGTAVSGTANLASAVELDDIGYIEARITNADNGVAHIWRFNTASSSSGKKSSSSCDAGLLGLASLIILAGAAFKIKK